MFSKPLWKKSRYLEYTDFGMKILLTQGKDMQI